jgi:anaerobic selenocysteine-containing dehydrogenase
MSTSRRQFLKRSGAAAAAAGVAAAMPQTAANALKRQADEHLPDHPSVDRPVMVHVTNMRKGLVTIYTSDPDHGVTIKDKRLTAAIYRLSR